MKKAMLSWLKRKKLFAVLFFGVVGSLLAQSSFLTDYASAATVTPEQCYALNGTSYNPNVKWMHSEEQDSCIDAKYCEGGIFTPLSCSEDVYKRLTGKVTVSASQCYGYNGSTYAADIAGGSTPEQLACITQGYCKEDTSASYRKPLLCSEEIYKASDQYKVVQTAAVIKAKEDAMVAPVTKLICGDAPAGEAAQSAYLDCAGKVRSYYKQCSVNDSGPIGSENTAATSIDQAKCIREKMGISSPSAAEIAAAIDEGKSAADKIVLDEGGEEDTICSNNEVLKDGECVAAVQCTGGQLGWILCPIMYVFSDFISVAADFIESMLFINPIGGQTELQNAWSSFVGIANLLLVVAFLVVIFSQATSLGLNAYGIKKMLPRIIAAAILINLSYFICTLALDIVNIIGGSVGGMIQSLMPATSSFGGEKLANSDTWVSWIQVGTVAFIAGGIAAAVGAIAFLVPVLLSMAFGVLSIFLAVAMRHAIVILLVIISPLAFAAMILPNTEPLFAKWRKMFTNMLFMYPIAMFLLYGAQLVGALVLLSKNITTDTAAGQNPVSDLIIDVVVALIIVLVPTYGLWKYVSNADKLIAMGTGALGKIGASARKASQGWAKEKYNNSTFARTRAWSKSVRDAARIERQGQMEGKGARARYNRAMSYAAGVSSTPNYKDWKTNAGKYQASAVNRAAIEADKIFKEDKDNAHAAFAKNGIAGPLMVAHARSGRVVRENEDGSYSYGRKLTEAEHSAAVEWTMNNGKLAERMEVYGSDWAARGRTPEYTRALDAMNDGYFHSNKDVVRFGNKFGGTMTSGTVGGDVGVDNAAFVNMASGKTAPEAIIDNDMAQTMADLAALDDKELENRIKTYNLLPPAEKGKPQLSVQEYIDQFRKNSSEVANRIFSTKELAAKVKPEFEQALKDVAGGKKDPLRVPEASKKNVELGEKRQRLLDGKDQVPNLDYQEIPNLQPTLEKKVTGGP